MQADVNAWLRLHLIGFLTEEEMRSLQKDSWAPLSVRRLLSLALILGDSTTAQTTSLSGPKRV